VIDYAESRVEQLDAILPQLALSASERQPVRVLLLVRARNWGTLLRHHSDALDAVLDDIDVRTLEDLPLELDERRALFAAAAAALAARNGDAVSVPAAPDGLDQVVFVSPLTIVIAAYLAVHRDPRSAQDGGSGPHRRAPRCAHLRQPGHRAPVSAQRV